MRLDRKQSGAIAFARNVLVQHLLEVAIGGNHDRFFCHPIAVVATPQGNQRVGLGATALANGAETAKDPE